MLAVTLSVINIRDYQSERREQTVDALPVTVRESELIEILNYVILFLDK